jgi:hypothetical protein
VGAFISYGIVAETATRELGAKLRDNNVTEI